MTPVLKEGKVPIVPTQVASRRIQRVETMLDDCEFKIQHIALGAVVKGLTISTPGAD